MNKFIMLLCLSIASLNLCGQEKTVKLKILETSDIHGNFFPYCFITSQELEGGLSRVSSLIKKERKTYGDNIILLDNGDILQGQPTAYYYNYIDSTSNHLCADVMNYIGYTVGNMGNHDVEASRPVFERWIENCNFPILGANIIDTLTNEPYLPPYQIVERDGVKVAILGMVTPAIPAWLPENLWSGLRFDDMEETAHKWVKHLQEVEKIDVLIGLFHSGQDALRISDMYNENAALNVAINVPGFDVVMMGHDHRQECKKIMNVAGDSVWVINPANDGNVIGDITVTAVLKDGKVIDKNIEGVLTDVNAYPIDEDYMKQFESQYNDVNQFVSKKLGTLTEDISTRSAFFGPSGFVDLIHQLQLDISGAEISLAAPLSFDATVNKGDIFVSDMFNFYKYENLLYIMLLSGKEVKNFLEESYYNWTNQMKSSQDHLLWFNDDADGYGNRERYKLKNISFNFDSAAGIIYTVDVTKPKGEKINIISMADGSSFSPDKMYKVALNSYRGNGGGELLTKGAGIAQEELKNRIVYSSDKDLRYYMIQYIEKRDTVVPQVLNQWKFIPEDWVKSATDRDYKKLFGN